MGRGGGWMGWVEGRTECRRGLWALSLLNYRKSEYVTEDENDQFHPVWGSRDRMPANRIPLFSTYTIWFAGSRMNGLD